MKPAYLPLVTTLPIFTANAFTLIYLPSESEMSQLAPGAFVRNPDRPDWGLGQVQSVIGARVTVNFEHAGKVLINTDVVLLALIEPDPSDREEDP